MGGRHRTTYSGRNRFGSILFGSGLFENSSARFGSVRFEQINFPVRRGSACVFRMHRGSVRFGSVRFCVRFRPVPEFSRSVRFGFLFLPVINRFLDNINNSFNMYGCPLQSRDFLYHNRAPKSAYPSIYISLSIYAYIYIYIHMNLSVYIYIYICTHMIHTRAVAGSAFTPTRRWAGRCSGPPPPASAWLHIYIYIYTCMYVCMYMYVYTYIYIYIYIL